MKLVLRFLAVCGLFGAFAFADMPIPATSLPQKAQSFIANTLKDNITMAMQDNDSFEVMLSNGYKVEFYLNGDWKEIENYNGVASAVFPAPVSSAIAKAYPNVNIIKVEKEWSGFEVKLASRMKIYVDTNGNILGQKMDD
ncbi:MAG: PepSY-like domain-containing protein [Helicobacteraceae bacterium]|nr:PepSY-like domain-containing protein [Helicobacteraceae bacterium]